MYGSYTLKEETTLKQLATLKEFVGDAKIPGAPNPKGLQDLVELRVFARKLLSLTDDAIKFTEGVMALKANSGDRTL